MVCLITVLSAAPMLFGQAAAPKPPQSRAQALAQCKDFLKQEIAVARQYLNFTQMQMKLGVLSDLDLYVPQYQVAELEGELAALNGGLIPRLPATPASKEVAEARKQYRTSLETQIDLLKKNADAAKTKYQLGTGETTGTMAAQLAVLDTRLQAAAFDAGLSWQIQPHFRPLAPASQPVEVAQR